jgi:hypothetical protein
MTSASVVRGVTSFAAVVSGKLNVSIFFTSCTYYLFPKFMCKHLSYVTIYTQMYRSLVRKYLAWQSSSLVLGSQVVQRTALIRLSLCRSWRTIGKSSLLFLRISISVLLLFNRIYCLLHIGESAYHLFGPAASYFLLIYFLRFAGSLFL